MSLLGQMGSLLCGVGCVWWLLSRVLVVYWSSGGVIGHSGVKNVLDKYYFLEKKYSLRTEKENEQPGHYTALAYFLSSTKMRIIKKSIPITVMSTSEPESAVILVRSGIQTTVTVVISVVFSL